MGGDPDAGEGRGRDRGFETVLLGPHGGELDGFTLVYGTSEQLYALQMREEMVALRARAILDHAKLSVIPALVGEGAEKQFALTKEILAEYEREPALV